MENGRIKELSSRENKASTVSSNKVNTLNISNLFYSCEL